jgi:hypothetical protein
MSLVDDDMVKAFLSDRADQPKPPFEKRAVDAVAIADDIPR